MIKLSHLLASGLVLCATGGVAQPFQPDGTAGGWNIFFNEATGGCFMEKPQGPYVVQVGTEAAMLGEGEGEQFGFLAVYTYDTGPDIAQGEEREVVFDIDGERFSNTATGVAREDVRGGYVVSNDQAFAQSLAEKSTLTINPDGARPAAISLAGTMNAMDAVRSCQAEMSGAGVVDPDRTFVSKGAESGWNIFYHQQTGGCFMEQVQGPYVVQLGTEAALLGEGEDEEFGFLAVYTTDVGPQIEQGELRDVVLDLDGERFTYERTGVAREGLVGGYIVSNDPAFASSLAGKQSMTIDPDGPSSTIIDLTGTSAGIEAVRACQASRG